MVRVVNCHAGVLGSNPGGPRIFSLWNYFSSKKKVRVFEISNPDISIIGTCRSFKLGQLKEEYQPHGQHMVWVTHSVSQTQFLVIDSIYFLKLAFCQ